MTRVLVVHGHAMLAHALEAALDRVADVDVVGVADKLQTGIDMMIEHQADVAVLDAGLSGGDVADAVRRLIAVAPSVRVLVIDSVADHRSIAAAMHHGAAGYLLVRQPIDDLVSAIRSVRTGQTVVSPSLVPALLARLGAPTTRAVLSSREMEVLELLGSGHSTTDIAKKLGVSVNTGRNNIQAVLTKLGAHSKLEAVAIALRQGLIAPPRLAS